MTAQCCACISISGRPSRRPAPGSSYVLTTGTGSGKSLAYIIPIVDRVLAAKATGTYRPGIKAIVVYPMNALANSQLGELREVPDDRLPRWPAGHLRAVHRAGIAGGPGADHREPARHPADQLRDARTGPDPAQGTGPDQGGQGPLVPGPRRAAHLPRPPGRGRGPPCPPAPGHLRRDGRPVHRHLRHDDHGGRRRPRRSKRSPRWRPPCSAFPVQPADVIGETLERITDPAAIAAEALRQRISNPAPPEDFAAFTTDPLATWIEEVFGFEPGSPAASPRRRRRPPTLPEAAHQLAEQTGAGPGRMRASDQGHAAGRVADRQSRDGPPGVRVPAAPVPVQGRQRLRDPGAPGVPARHQHLPGRRAGRQPDDAGPHPGADGVLPRVRPGVPGGHQERYRGRADVCGPPGQRRQRRGRSERLPVHQR